MKAKEENTYIIKSKEENTFAEIIIYKKYNRITISYKGKLKIRFLEKVIKGLKEIEKFQNYEVQILNITF